MPIVTRSDAPSLALAVLAGVGLDAVVVGGRDRARSVPSLSCGFGAATVLLAALWLVGRDGGLPSFGTSLAAHVRAESFVWPVTGVVVGVAGAELSGGDSEPPGRWHWHFWSAKRSSSSPAARAKLHRAPMASPPPLPSLHFGMRWATPP